MMSPKWVLSLWLSILVSALTVVYVGHRCRLLVSELAEKQQTESRLQTAWGQYLLEQSSLATLTLIEKKAEQDLDMRVPKIQEAKMVQP